MNTERVLEGNLCNLFMVLMSQCDCEVKNELESITNFSDLERGPRLHGATLYYQETCLYTNDLNFSHNKAMAHMNIMNLYQDSRHSRVQRLIHGCAKMCAIK